MPIRTLPPLLVNQIAAGEVIERPASVVKELIENAIDAGATRIDVVVERGGRDLVQVTDDGAGIEFEELALAVAPHATSKITCAEDLDTIATMGFRGEALASIASVSRLSLRSRRAADERAGLIEVEGDVVRGPRPAAGPKGTTVIVRNLFFNTPARRKFLKTDQTESARVAEAVRTAALGNPAIGFTLRSDDRSRVDVPAGQEPRARVLAILGDELANELLEVRSGPDARAAGIELWGLAGTPEIARGTNRHQRVFLNGRAILDRSIAHAVKEAYRGLIEPSRFPTVVLFIQIDPALVDVNVHPAKAEVRFRDQATMHRAVHRAVLDALRGSDLTPALDVRVAPGAERALSIPPAAAPAFGHGRGGGGGGAPTGARSGGAAWSRSPAGAPGVYEQLRTALSGETADAIERGLREHDAETPLPQVRAVTEALQVHASFIVTQDEEGLVIIDQHALHERIMFEKLCARIDGDGGALPAQRLLVPAIVDVDAAEIEAIERLGPLLERLGIDAQQMSPTSIAVHAFPILLFERRVDPVSFMNELLARASGEGLADAPEAALHEVLDMMACKAAVKAGDRLTPAEIEVLLQERVQVERSSRCPHGRPTTLRLSVRELERQFGR